MRINGQISSEDKVLKEQIGCRVEVHVKRILENIAKKEFRTVANVAEKLICERLKDLGFLDNDFGPLKGQETLSDAEEENITPVKES
ncbi:MAG: hypothetical protein KKE57_06095 [Proteobacteria bacterium]|nr:hypothetical protein [Pseudomonadota bacterium]